MAKKQAAIGTLLLIGDGNSIESFFPVVSPKDITGPKKKTTTIDVTTQDSPNAYNEFIGSLKDGGEVTFPFEFDPSDPSHDETATSIGVGAGGLTYLQENRIKRNMKITIPSSPLAKFTFVGLVTGLDYDFKVLGSLMGTVTIKISGKPTLALGS